MVDFGPSFDTNLLNTPTPRRLMSLWMESASLAVPILPTVMDELMRGPRRHASQQEVRINTLHREGWRNAIEAPHSPFALLDATPDISAQVREIIELFDLKCFPELETEGQIANHPDAAIIAEGVAFGTDVVITNNMNSINHHEVNDLMARKMGKNTPVVVTADRAVLDAHPGGEAARNFLATALASAWPDDGRPLNIAETHDVLSALCKRLAEGVRMRETAEFLLVAFRIDDDLEQVIESARDLAATSNALECERRRTRHIAQGRSVEGGVRVPRVLR